MLKHLEYGGLSEFLLIPKGLNHTYHRVAAQRLTHQPPAEKKPCYEFIPKLRKPEIDDNLRLARSAACAGWADFGRLLGKKVLGT
jgi:hypothetical protein